MTKRSLLFPLGVLAVVLLVARPSHGDPGEAIDLGTAVAAAKKNNRLLLAAQIRIQEAQGDLIGASVLLRDNPQLEAGAGPRSPADSSMGKSTDVEVRLAQRIEIAGQRGLRMSRSSQEVAASRDEVADTERVVVLAVAQVFFEALAAAERVALAQDNERLAADLNEVAQTRVARGADTPVALNGAKIRLAQAGRELFEAQSGQRAALVMLGNLIGHPSDAPLDLLGKLPQASALPPLEQLVAQALSSRSDITALFHRLEASRSSAKLANVEAWSDIELGVTYKREQGDDIVVGGITVPLPLFNRNQGEVARARATVSRLEAEQRTLRAEVETEIRRAYLRFETATKTLELYDANVLRAQEENLGLLRNMFTAGKIAYIEVVLLQRELLEGRLGYLEARLQLANEDAALRASAGLDLTNTLLPEVTK
jgi:cobalt-zinc-cadmium efflux system outer membrane protein